MSIPIELMDQNPWWRNPKAILEDKYIKSLTNSKACWLPRLKYKFDFSADVIYTIRGPRQVGKTTLLKEMIKDLLDLGVHPRAIFYYTCELINNPRELVEKISVYLDQIRPSPKQRTYLFLDEISSVRDWQKAIKYLVDTGKLENTSTILTGSHTLDIKKAYEKLPGRRGQKEETLDKIMLPMKFAEYAETLNEDVRNTIRELNLLSIDKRTELLQQVLQGRTPEEIKELLFLAKELEKLFQDYLITGGTAKVVDEYLKHNEIPEHVYKTYIDVILGDLARWNKRESYIRQIINRVIETLGNPVGWNTLKQETDIAHHNTIAEYIDTLVDSFVLLYLYHYDVNQKAPAYQKEKKIHFQDPFYLHAMRAWISGKEPFDSTIEFLKETENIGKIAEGIVANHLVRLAFLLSKQKQLFTYETSVFYWRGRKDREVDFVLKAEIDSSVPIEVKYQQTISKKDLYGIIDFLKVSGASKGILLSKNKLETKRNAVIIPIWLFLLIV
jgi:predicted AAA+ superfamily ATPase